MMLINVLPKEMYEDCHIKGSINVPFDQLSSFAQDLEKEQPIAVYCASYTCKSSRKAWELLNEMGFTQLWAYEGGMAEWYHAGFPYEGACKAPYLSKEIEKPEEVPEGIKQIEAEELRFLLEKHGLFEA